uniref:Uncharacterized protein n=1 Tax=Mycena chlorophos TaxID=658473 RepID=A0ABQ0LTC9_MYCCL|nr:predicted protein [Mycena chlorophos]
MASLAHYKPRTHGTRWTTAGRSGAMEEQAGVRDGWGMVLDDCCPSSESAVLALPYQASQQPNSCIPAQQQSIPALVPSFATIWPQIVVPRRRHPVHLVYIVWRHSSASDLHETSQGGSPDTQKRVLAVSPPVKASYIVPQLPRYEAEPTTPLISLSEPSDTTPESMEHEGTCMRRFWLALRGETLATSTTSREFRILQYLHPFLVGIACIFG